MARSLRDELLRAGLVTSEQASRAERGSRRDSSPGKGRAARRTTSRTRHRDARDATTGPRRGSPKEGRTAPARALAAGSVPSPAHAPASPPVPAPDSAAVPGGAPPRRAAPDARTRRQRDRSKRGRAASALAPGSAPASARGAPSAPTRVPEPASSPAPVESPHLDPEERLRQLNLEIRHILDTEAEQAQAEGEVPFHFPRGDRVRHLYVSEDQRRRLAEGELAIVGFRGRHHLVPRRAGERVGELRPEVFVFIAADETEADTVVEGYEGYEVPDELRW